MDASLVVTLDNLYPALIQCFAVIICGYVAGRIGLVTEEQSSGLNTFVGTFSLPSLIFLSLASLNLSDVNWYFLLAILVSKALVFLSVVLVTLLVSRTVQCCSSWRKEEEDQEEEPEEGRWEDQVVERHRRGRGLQENTGGIEEETWNGVEPKVGGGLCNTDDP
ncbi:integral membrane protein GPR155-like, partial [Homalodisca vitripennis]|uniref:integral membrane protein GPR155-like n=1 Tax=Homalodisca vitripennis TaxID=197043 RepID=UPI001EEA38EB